MMGVSVLLKCICLLQSLDPFTDSGGMGGGEDKLNGAIMKSTKVGGVCTIVGLRNWLDPSGG